MRRVVRAVAAVTVLAAGLATGGCWNRVPVEERALVAMLGVDQSGSGAYVLTVAMLFPPGLPPPGPAGQGGASGSQPVVLRSATSADPLAALQAIQTATSLQLDFTHLEALVVSEPVARSGLAPVVGALARLPVFSVNEWLVVARGMSAAGLLQKTAHDLPEPNTVLSRTITRGQWATPYFAQRISELLKEMPAKGQDFVTAGVLTPTAPSPAVAVPVELTGLALFRGGGLAGWLDGGAALGWMAATGHLQHQTMSVDRAGWRFDLVLLGDRPSVAVRPTPDGPSVSMRLSVAAQLANLLAPTSAMDLTPATLASLEALGDEALTGDVEAALTQARTIGADPFGLGEYVRIADPAYWSRVRDTWGAASFGQLPVAVRVELTIQSAGTVVCPIASGCG